MNTQGYQKLPVDCDLSFVSLQDAAKLLEPARIYILTVSTQRDLEMIYNLKSWLASSIDNPFAPFINLKTSSTFKRYEWTLQAEGYEKIVGSPGVD